jgi:hypothetical protein
MLSGAPPIREFLSGGIGVELIYSFIIIVCSLMIYFATKEMEKLTSHKGIRYFRLSFLFFAIAYFLRYFIRFFLFLFRLNEIQEFSPMLMGALTLFAFLYFSSMAILFLLYSVMWKRWKHSRLTLALLNLFALAIALVSILIRQIWVYLAINLALLLIITVIIIEAYKDSRSRPKSKSLFLFYLMLSVFCILNIADVLTPRFLSMFHLLVYLASILLFMLMLYKVLKTTGG